MAAQRRPRRQSRVRRAAAPRVPRDHSRIPHRRGGDRPARCRGEHLVGACPVHLFGLTRYVSRRSILAVGGVIFGAGICRSGVAPTGFAGFAAANVASRVAGSPQHPVGNGLLAEQFPEHRRGFAISAHIAGGNVGTVAVPLLGAWLIAGYRLALDCRAVRCPGHPHCAGHVRADARVGFRSGRRPRVWLGQLDAQRDCA